MHPGKEKKKKHTHTHTHTQNSLNKSLQKHKVFECVFLGLGYLGPFSNPISGGGFLGYLGIGPGCFPPFSNPKIHQGRRHLADLRWRRRWHAARAQVEEHLLVTSGAHLCMHTYYRYIYIYRYYIIYIYIYVCVYYIYKYIIYHVQINI